MKAEIEINRTDVYWNYVSTFMRLSSSILLLPIILKILPSDKVALWSIIITLTSLTGLLDFGFSSSFTRNVTYIFSGAKKLYAKGFDDRQITEPKVDMILLAKLIVAMKYYYSRLAWFFLLLLATIGTYYISIIVSAKGSELVEILATWILMISASTYGLYTYYYDALLKGRGMIKISMKISVIGNLIYLAFAALLLLANVGLIGIGVSQVLSIIVIRKLSIYYFYRDLNLPHLSSTDIKIESRGLLRILFENSAKIGLTTIGAFLVSKSASIIGSLYLALDAIASYLISVQVIGVLVTLSNVYLQTFIPKIVQLRVQGEKSQIRGIYLNARVLLVGIFLLLGTLLIFLGPKLLAMLGSQTLLLEREFLSYMLLFALLETNHSFAGSILLTRNEVPFFKASLFAGFLTILLMFIGLEYVGNTVWVFVFAPGIAQVVYQNWRWPIMVSKDLKRDF